MSLMGLLVDYVSVEGRRGSEVQSNISLRNADTPSRSSPLCVKLRAVTTRLMLGGLCVSALRLKCARQRGSEAAGWAEAQPVAIP